MTFAPKIYFTEPSTDPMLAQLQELTCLTHDADIKNYQARDELLEYGYIARTEEGWNFLTKEGVTILDAFHQIGIYGPRFITKPKPTPKKVSLNDQEQLLYNSLPAAFTGPDIRRICSQLKLSSNYFYMAYKRKFSQGLIRQIARGKWEKIPQEL